jgi:hypothetical protein
VTNAWQVFIADDTSDDADHVPFRLGASGDAIGLANSNGVPIDSVSWIVVQQADVSEGRLPDGAATVVRFPGTPSPGDANFLSLTNVVVNEVLTHTDPPLEDAIELHNPTTSPVSVAGWWLSDSRGVPQKYQISPNTPTIPPGGFLVLYENQFNNGDEATIPFALSSADGDQVYLSSANVSGQMNGFRTFVNFGPSANGVSFGRYRTSVGIDFTAMAQRTFGVDAPVSVAQFRAGTGKTNSYPRIGSVVISEIMYHPPDLVGVPAARHATAHRRFADSAQAPQGRWRRAGTPVGIERGRVRSATLPVLGVRRTGARPNAASRRGAAPPRRSR